MAIDAERVSQLSSWRTTEEFSTEVYAILSATSCEDLLVRACSAATTLREAFVVAEFAKAVRDTHCRMAAPRERFPDAECKTSDGWTRKIEVTEAMETTRRRGDEVRKGVPVEIEHDALISFREQWSERLFEVLKKKCLTERDRKVFPKYGDEYLDILIYDNMTIFSDDRPFGELSQSVGAFLQFHKLDASRNIWVLRNNGQLFPVWTGFRYPIS